MLINRPTRRRSALPTSPEFAPPPLLPSAPAGPSCSAHESAPSSTLLRLPRWRAGGSEATATIGPVIQPSPLTALESVRQRGRIDGRGYANASSLTGAAATSASWAFATNACARREPPATAPWRGILQPLLLATKPDAPHLLAAAACPPSPSSRGRSHEHKRPLYDPHGMGRDAS